MPDFDLTTATHNLGCFEQRADRVDREIAALQASQHRRASHLVLHRSEEVDLDAIGDVIRDRVRQQTSRVVKDPPTYITETLGPRPTDRTKDRAWVRAVVEIEQYRTEHHITDVRTTIGPESTGRDAARAWNRASDAIGGARQAIVPRKPVVRPELPEYGQGPTRLDRPSLGIG